MKIRTVAMLLIIVCLATYVVARPNLWPVPTEEEKIGIGLRKLEQARAVEVETERGNKFRFDFGDEGMMSPKDSAFDIIPNQVQAELGGKPFDFNFDPEDRSIDFGFQKDDGPPTRVHLPIGEWIGAARRRRQEE